MDVTKADCSVWHLVVTTAAWWAARRAVYWVERWADQTVAALVGTMVGPMVDSMVVRMAAATESHLVVQKAVQWGHSQAGR